MLREQDFGKEQMRLEDLYAYQILDSGDEEDFNELVELASEIAGTPISLISLVDKDRQWFKARKGLQYTGTSRDVSFCSHAIDSEEELLIVNDASADARFARNKLVTEDPHIRFYAGFPLVSQKGYKLGTLCVIDQRPRILPRRQIRKLQTLARQVMKLIELRLANKKLQALREAEERQKKTLEKLLENQRRILTILAHDTAGPIYSMNQLLQLFLQDLVPSEEAKKFYELMSEQTSLTTGTIESLVKWGQIHLNGVKDEQRSTPVQKVVETVFRHFQSKAEAKNLQLVNAVPEENCLPFGEEALAFVLRNLVNNAIKFTEKGTITVSGCLQGAWFYLTVSDTGRGMPESQVEGLFKGLSASTPGTRKEQGSGIGLLLVNDFVEQAGGFIEVKSTVHVGTNITISLPVYS